MTIMRMLCAALLVVGALSATGLSPLYGVPSDKAQSYDPATLESTKAFACLDGKAQIPHHMVNDDYCDCADGSDEPGTGACSNVEAFPSTLMFECKNKGHRPQLIFHSRVGDRVCDCCDGSDEKVIKCENTCAEHAVKFEAEEKARAERRAAGLAAKESLRAKADAVLNEKKQRLAEAKEKLATMGSQVEEALQKKTEEEKFEAEEREKIKAKSLEDKAEHDAAAAERKANEGVAEKPTHEEMVCVGWRQTKDCVSSGERETDHDKHCDARIEGGTSGFCECINQNGQNVQYKFDCGHEEFTCNFLCTHSGDPNADKEDADASDEFKVDDGSSFTLASAEEARKEYNDLVNQKGTYESDISTIESDLERNWGPDGIFIALHGECFTKEDKDYTYTLCPFNDVKQKAKHGYSDTTMGRWDKWGEQTYGAWGGQQDYSRMLYNGGDRCWSGPERTTEVVVFCGPESALMSVDEPSMCTYKMSFQTPVVCE